MKILFLGASKFSVPFLNSIYRSEHQVAAIITNPDKKKGRGKINLPNPVKSSAADLGIKVFETISIDTDLIKHLEQVDFNSTVVVSFGVILPGIFLNMKKRNINVHPSLLPEYRGPTPIQSVLINGEEKTGISIMEMVEKMDAGPIYSQVKFKILENENKDSLEERIIKMGCPLLINTLNLIEKGKLDTFSQDDSRANFTSMITKKDLKIDWNERAERINNKIRAFSYKPGCYTFLGTKRIKILKGSVRQIKKNNIDPGTVLVADRSGGLFVACGGAKALAIEQIQSPGKNIMGYKDFLNGYPLKAGDKFG